MLICSTNAEDLGSISALSVFVKGGSRLHLLLFQVDVSVSCVLIYPSARMRRAPASTDQVKIPTNERYFGGGRCLTWQSGE